jgi:WD40 repeat protein
MEIEANYWFKCLREGEVLIIVTTGAARTWPEIRDHLLPPVVAKNLAAEPLWVSLQHRRESILASTKDRQLHKDLTEDFKQIFLRFYPDRDWSELRGEERRHRRRFKLAVSFIVALLVLLSTIVVRSTRYAKQQEIAAQVEKLANYSRSEVGKSPDRALLLSVKATSLADMPTSRESLLNALQHQPLLIYFRGHGKQPVTAVIVLVDGKTAASSDESGRILFWEIRSGIARGPAIVQPGPVTALAVSSDGKTLASAGPQGTLLWDVSTRQQKGKPLIGEGLVNALAFSPDGTLVSGDSNGTLAFWDPASKTTGRSVNSGLGAIFAIAFDRNGGTLAVGGEKGLRLFDTDSRLWRGDFPGERTPIFGLSFEPDGSRLAAASGDGTIFIQDTNTGKTHSLSPRTGAKPQAIIFSPDAKEIICGDADGVLKRWSAEAAAAISPDWRGSGQAVSAVAASRQDGTLLAGYRDGTVVVWDAARPNVLADALPDGHTQSVSSLAFSPDGSRLISASYDKQIILWDVLRRQRLGDLVMNHSSTVQSVAVSPDGSKFAFTDGHRLLSIGSLDKTTRGILLVPGPLAYSNLTFVENGRSVMYGTRDGVAFVDVTGRNLSEVRLVSGAVTNVVYDTTADRVAASGRDGNITLLRGRAVQQGKPMAHGSNITTLAFSQDGEILASGGDNGKIIAWQVSNRSQLWRITAAHSGEVLALAFSPDGSMLASGGFDHVALWDAHTGQPIGSFFSGDDVTIQALEFNKDKAATLLASGDQDGSIVLWEASLTEWKAHAGSIVRRRLDENDQNYLTDKK